MRKGNPKGIKDWDDLAKSGISVVTPNPKTSGGARWNYLAAWGYALKANGGDEAKAKAFVAAIFKNVPVLDAGARGSTNTFVQRGIGDVLLAWENEAMLAINELGPDKFEIVIPSVSILAEPPVAVIEANARKHGTLEVAKGLSRVSLFPRRAKTRRQALLSARPSPKWSMPRIWSGSRRSPPSRSTTCSAAGRKAQKAHFADGGSFDQIYAGK